MNFEMTRDVARDLWSLCQMGEASADSRALVEKYLAQDGDFAARLKETAMHQPDLSPLRLSPDAERQYLDHARTQARNKFIVMLVAIGVGGAILAMMANAAVIWARMSAFHG